MEEPIPDYWLDVHFYKAAIDRQMQMPYSPNEMLEMPAGWVSKLFDYVHIVGEARLAKQEMISAGK